ncbi:MFS transporter [Nocardiopsis potens]|uniref:MFS transporter n=1 Tax=Nocardiopsis potens TaxID=1246458 RepID=UPI000345D403|nr:MFS transporter [Nocardiopsis potens]
MTAAEEAAPARGAAPDPVRVQRKAVTALVIAQVIGGLGVGSALSVGGLIAEDLTGSQTWAGMATTTITLGAALFSLPLAGLAARRGRRPGLGLGWMIAALGGAVAIAGAQAGYFPVFLAGMALYGSGTATNLQARHAAADLAAERTRGRDLSLVVWATTIGSVIGPNLTGPGAAVASRLGLLDLLGPLLFSTVAFTLAGLVTFLLLRPDPLLLARELETGGGGPAAPAKASPRASIAVIARNPRALLALVGTVASHTVMVAVMTMTPVHMAHGGAELTVIGLTISLHIAGMYAFSPLVGWLSDRIGRVPVLFIGQGVLLAAAAVAGTAGHSTVLVTTGLVLLGLGWSFGLVSSSALLADSLAPHERPGAQGVTDLLMNLGGAAAGAASGAVLAGLGFGGLNAFAALFVLPVVLLALRARRPR